VGHGSVAASGVTALAPGGQRGLRRYSAGSAVPTHQEPAGMPIELSREARQEAVASIERWFLENRDEKVGNITAGALLGFILEEIGPAVYNKAVADVQERLLERVQELDIEVHEDEFQYWRKFDKARKGKG
jgi:uncharacterized protein (DUF2164 family)